MLLSRSSRQTVNADWLQDYVHQHVNETSAFHSSSFLLVGLR